MIFLFIVKYGTQANKKYNQYIFISKWYNYNIIKCKNIIIIIKTYIIIWAMMIIILINHTKCKNLHVNNS